MVVGLKQAHKDMIEMADLLLWLIQSRTINLFDKAQRISHHQFVSIKATFA